MRSILCALVVITAVPLAAATVNNNDSCDIATLPAATLLLPYFEVDLGSPGSGNTTIFSMTNVSPSPQIARVTIWTDWAFPVLRFNVFLTGYDVQPINLYDVIAQGFIQQTSTSSPNPERNPNLGTTPLPNLDNPHFRDDVKFVCVPSPDGGHMTRALAEDLRRVLSSGQSSGSTISCPNAQGVQQQVGGNHGGKVAIGYVTIDVVSTCSLTIPMDAAYWSEMLYDNVLTGDYAHVANNGTSGNYAGGNPMVHIRAIAPGVLPYTFYDRFTKDDRRQPLPSVFAARWIASREGFDTQYTIWREGVTNASATCEQYAKNGSIDFAEIVRFDEHENAAVGGACTAVCIPEPIPYFAVLPATALLPQSSSTFPWVAGSPDAGGWTYFNLNSGTFDSRASQNWVVLSMFAEGRFGVEYDATALGNGCSPAAALTKNAPIGPAQ